MRWRPTLSSPCPHQDDSFYGSHRAVLEAIAKTFTIKTAFEFGIGKYSTATFLDRVAFQDLERLVSFETNSDWVERAKREDPRHEIVVAPPDTLTEICNRFGRADLVLVDGMDDHRIASALASKEFCDLIVYHDVEEPLHRRIFKEFRFYAVHREIAPWTAILTDDGRTWENVRRLQVPLVFNGIGQ